LCQVSEEASSQTQHEHSLINILITSYSFPELPVLQLTLDYCVQTIVFNDIPKEEVVHNKVNRDEETEILNP